MIRTGLPPRQPRSLTLAERMERSTRPDLWPVFSPPPELPPLPARQTDPELDDVLDLLD